MDDLQSLSGRRAWASEEETPLSFFERLHKPESAIVKPLSLETEDLEDPVPVTKKHKPSLQKNDLQNQDEVFLVYNPKTVNELVIRLSWDHVGYIIAGLLFVYMMYQLHSMSARLVVLEAALRR